RPRTPANPAGPGRTIAVGGLVDEPGPVDATVERDTVRSYFNMVNEQGGVNGKTLQLVDCDSRFDTTDAANCANKLIHDNKVFAVVGWAGVGEDTTVKSFNDAGIPIVGGLGTPKEYEYPLSFPVSANFVTYGTAMAQRASDLGFTDAAIVVVNVPFIIPVKAELERSLRAHGITVKDEEVVEATKANYADVVLAMQSKGVKSIAVALDPFSYARLFQSMQGAGFKPPLIGLGLDKGSANPSPSRPDQGYGRFVEGMHSLTPMLEPADHPDDPSVRLYLDTVKKYFPNQVAPLDVYTEQSWSGAQLFVDALKRAGPNPTQQKLVDALNTTRNFKAGLPSVPLSFSPGPRHDPNRCFWMLRNQGLVWRTVSDVKCF
ncbi:MAG: ABC transporter substrate-binding protein, partial [Acidimicrobiales bacterium]